ncbi:hypothetical protein [Streptomyces sp. NPDC001919]
MEMIEKTGVGVSWVQCTECSGVGRVILGTDPVGPVLEAGGRHVAEAHSGKSAVDVLALHVEDASVFRNVEGLGTPRVWLDGLNQALPSDF